MAIYVGKLSEALSDLPPGVIIGSLAIALTLALIGSGLHALVWGKKARASVAPLFGLMFLVSFVSMAVAFGYARLSLREAQGRPGEVGWPSVAQRPGRAILEAGDVDRDGRLTPREAFELVRRADTSRRGYADFFDLDHVRLPELSKLELEEGPRALPRIHREPPMEACFPPTGGATGHERWPMVTWHSEPPRSPR